MFLEAGLTHDVHPALVAAVGYVESGGWDPEVIACERWSTAGARGLMQFMIDTAKGIPRHAALAEGNVDHGIDPCDPYEAIMAGAWYLAAHYGTFGSWELALAAYNAGTDAVTRAGPGIPPFPETQAYVPAVLEKARDYAAGGTFTTRRTGGPAPQAPSGGALGPPSTRGWEQGMTPAADRYAAALRRLGFDGTLGGYRANAVDPHGHPAGNAWDVMVPLTAQGKAVGDAIVAWTIANADALGVDYILWYQDSYHRSRGFAPRRMADRGSPTANHLDHPHVQFVR